MNTSQVQYPTPNLEEQLLEAARESSLEKLEYVLSYGTVDLAVTDSDSGGTALHLACKNTHPQIVRLLLKNGLNINAVDKIQNTPLHLAAFIGNGEIVTLLLDRGADLAFQNKEGATAEDVASTDEIRQLIKARPGLRQFQQAQSKATTAAANEATHSQVEKDKKLAEQIQQQEFAGSELARHFSDSPLPAVTSAVSTAFPVVSVTTGSSIQEDAAEYINERNVQAKVVEIHILLCNNKNYFEASSLIKAVLKFCDKQTDKQKYRTIEYQCFTRLGDIYLKKSTRKEDLQDYPKATALYQYARRMIEPSELPAKEARLKVIDAKLVKVEEKFISDNKISNTADKFYPSIIVSYKEELNQFRQSIKQRLDALRNLGVKNDKFDEGELFERAKTVEKIYDDIRNFFIGHQENNEGLFVKLIDHARTTLGLVPHAAEYAIIGLGSMALGTMTPWSDIEFAILIQEGLDENKTKEVKDYFFKLTTLFHIHIINLGETELAAMAIKELNDFTQANHDDWFWDKLMPKGLSFDAQRPIGCKTPLGRSGFNGHKDYSLICTPTELAEYQDKWENCEATLPHLLLNTVLIDKGNTNNKLLESYNQLMRKGNKLSQLKQKSVKLVQEAIDKYSPAKTINAGEGESFEVKKDIYRYLDRVFMAFSCNNHHVLYNLTHWSLLAKMKELSLLRDSDEAYKYLMIAFSIACELRLIAEQPGFIEPVVKGKIFSYQDIFQVFFYITSTIDSSISEHSSEFGKQNNSSTLFDMKGINLDRISDILKINLYIRCGDDAKADELCKKVYNC